MGKKNFLIDGVSGSGKTTVATELNKRGYQAIHGDRELKYRGNPVTGKVITPGNYIHTPEWMSEHQLWDVSKVKKYVENKNEDYTFFCGGARNQSKFQNLLDGVFILDVDKDTMIKRIKQRIAIDPSDFGSKPEEMKLILELHRTKKDIPGEGIVIDSMKDLNDVVDEIIRICRTM